MSFASRALRFACVLSSCAALLLAEPAVRAQDADARARAAAHWKRGVEQASAHAYAEALAEFEAAYALVQHAAVLYNIALAQVGLNRPAAALATLRRYLAEPVEAGDAKRKAAEATRLELEARLAEAPPGQLTIVIFPYGKVWLDGRVAGASPLTLSVPAGPHRVSGGREAEERSADVVLESGQSQRVVLAWTREDLVRDSR